MPEEQKAWRATVQTTAPIKFQERKRKSLSETIENSFQRAFVILWGVWEKLVITEIFRGHKDKKINNRKIRVEQEMTCNDNLLDSSKQHSRIAIKVKTN